ncbi:MAG: CPBP family intramembrane metalloprotease [Armatimonadetes bacterium]|nr:CPBP family intramembrane metalloprotease [Armatimonadota bacterium]
MDLHEPDLRPVAPEPADPASPRAPAVNPPIPAGPPPAGEAPPPAPPGRVPPRPWPGWLSALLYLATFLLVAVAGKLVFYTPLAVLTYLKLGTEASAPGMEALLDPRILGPGTWILLTALAFLGEFGLVLGLTALLCRRVERCSLAETGWFVRPTWQEPVVGLLLSVFFLVWVVGIGAALGWYEVRAAYSPYPGWAVLLVSLGILLPPAAVEELACRGYLYRALGRSWGPMGAVLGNALVFAVLHAANPGFEASPLAWVGLFLSGVYLTAAYRVTGNLWLVTFLHAGWNLMEGPVLGLPVSGTAPPISCLQTLVSGPPLWTGGEFGPEAGLLLCLLLPIHMGLLWLIRPLFQRRVADSTSKNQGQRVRVS